jgi:alpha 1,3-glucosidase
MQGRETTQGSAAGAYGEPYRLYNLDVFEYEIDEPMALYGHIPLLVAHSAQATVSAFWNNPSETFVDVSDDEQGSKRAHWMSESGVLDLFVLLGPRPKPKLVSLPNSLVLLG